MQISRWWPIIDSRMFLSCRGSYLSRELSRQLVIPSPTGDGSGFPKTLYSRKLIWGLLFFTVVDSFCRWKGRQIGPVHRAFDFFFRYG
jgi:hypothetical protein